MNETLIISTILVWIVVLFNLLVTLALVRRVNALNGAQSKSDSQRQSGSSGPGPKVGQPAPAFTAVTLQGEQVTLASYAGRSVAFIFFSTTCEPCREALPSYESALAKAERAGVDLVLVSTNDSADSALTRAFVEENNIRLPVLVAPLRDNSFFKDYNFDATPSYCLVDERGIVQSAGYPSFKWGEWKALVDSWEDERESEKEGSKKEAQSDLPVAGMAMAKGGD